MPGNRSLPGGSNSPRRWTLTGDDPNVALNPDAHGPQLGPDESVEVVEAAAYDALREAAWWVVMNWDLERSQAGAMPDLRGTLGLSRQRPTREEAQARLDAYLADPTLWGAKR